MKTLAALLATLTLISGCVVAPRHSHRNNDPEYRVVVPGEDEHHHHHHDHGDRFCPPGQERHGRC